MPQKPYRCRPQYLWRGIQSKFAQKTQTAKNDPRHKSASIALLLLVPFLGLLLVAQSVSKVGTPAVEAIYEYGSLKAAAIFGGLIVLLVLCLPLYAVFRGIKWVQATCRQGWELSQVPAEKPA
jgi:hypothetical protein